MFPQPQETVQLEKDACATPKWRQTARQTADFHECAGSEWKCPANHVSFYISAGESRDRSALPGGDLEPIPERVTFVRQSAFSPAAYMRTITRLLLQRRTFDIVVCGHINLLPVAALFTRHPVLFVYGVEAWKPVRRSQRLLKRTRAVVSISDITRQRFLAWSRYDGTTFLLSNAIHLDQYGIRPRDPKLASRYGVDGKAVLLTLGRITPTERYKGFDETINALPAIIRSRPDVVYLIAGTGDDVPRLKKRAHDLGVAGHVIFTGYVAETEKHALYSLADAFVLPSRGEGFGFVLLEAMATGVPVIASTHDGGREAVRDGMLGALVDPSNDAEITRAVLDALANGKHCIPPGLEYFSYRNFEERLHAIINEIESET